MIAGGHGSTSVTIVTRLAEFRGWLYAAGMDTTLGCQLWRSQDGKAWDVVVGPDAATPSGFGDAGNQSVNKLVAFGGWLYAGTWNQLEGAELWRSQDGVRWLPVVGGSATTSNGFGKLENSGMTALGVHQGRLWAGTGSLYCKDGVELWVSSDGALWEPVAGERFALQTAFARESKYLLDLISVGGYLYTASGDQRTGGSEIWRSQDGQFWEAVVGAPSPYRAGMGNPNHDMIYDLETFSGVLYAAVLDFAKQGGALWRSPNGTTWEVIVGDPPAKIPAGFGQTGNIGLVSLSVFEDALYAGVTSEAGAQLWRSDDGMTWRQIVGPDGATPAGFGTGSNRSINCLRVFKGRLYAGTDNSQDGAELWRLGASDQPTREPGPR